MMPLTEFHIAILGYVSTSERKKSEITEEFESPQLRRAQIKNILLDLEQCGYIRPVQLLSGVVQWISLDGRPDSPSETEDGYEITQLGTSRAQSNRTNIANTTYSNINNANIAHNSSNANQIIKISEQPEEIQKKIAELQYAVLTMNKTAIKKTFSYIADKSVDAAIALLTGRLLK